MWKTDVSLPGSMCALLPDFYSRVPQMQALGEILDNMMVKFYENINRMTALRLLTSEDVSCITPWEEILSWDYLLQPGAENISIEVRKALIRQFLYRKGPVNHAYIRAFLDEVCDAYEYSYDNATNQVTIKIKVPSSALFRQIKKCVEALLPVCLQLQIISLVPQNEERKNVTHEMMSGLTHAQLRTQTQPSPETIETTEA